MAVETAAQRYDRDWLHVNDDRKVRTVDFQSQERLDRLYVDRESGESAVVRGDRDPLGASDDVAAEVVYAPFEEAEVTP